MQAWKCCELVYLTDMSRTALPQEFDKSYRNPCWTDANGRFRCGPYFQIIGVSKCGTTDLYGRLNRHPDMAEGAKVCMATAMLRCGAEVFVCCSARYVMYDGCGRGRG